MDKRSETKNIAQDKSMRITGIPEGENKEN